MSDTPSSPFIEHPETPRKALFSSNRSSPVRSTHATPSLHGTPSTASRFSRTPREDVIGLKKTISQLRYDLEALKQEQQVAQILQEEKERELEAKHKKELDRAEQAESDQVFLFNKQKELSDENRTLKEELRSLQSQHEADGRELNHELEGLKDLLNDLQSENRALVSEMNYKIEDYEHRIKAASTTTDDLLKEVENRGTALTEAKMNVVKFEQLVESLKGESLDLKQSAKDLEAVEQTKSQLSDQIKYSRELEAKVSALTVRVEAAESAQQLSQVYEEDLSSMKGKLKNMEGLRQQLAEQQLQILVHEENSAKWKAYLEKSDEFKTVEEVVTALNKARMEKASLLERAGSGVNDETRSTAEAYARLQERVTTLESELQLAQNQLKTEKKKVATSIRQHTLAANEAKFLREQLKAYDDEEVTAAGADVKQGRIDELEKLLEAVKNEKSVLEGELKEARSEQGCTVAAGTKRPRADDSVSSEVISEYTRKLQTLQQEFDEVSVEARLLAKTKEALEARLESLEKSQESRVRILELRENPTSRHEAVKQSMLDTLKAENEALMGKNENSKSVPQASLERKQLELQGVRDKLASTEKSYQRLKEVFSVKSLEFREAVYALTGYQIDILRNKKVKVTSMYAQSDEDSFTFLPDPNHKGQFAGVIDSPLTDEFSNIVDYWVKDKKDFPCFLAALNLELYERKENNGNQAS
jgi:mitotic spindle assembly checkpoint protein MAD1